MSGRPNKKLYNIEDGWFIEREVRPMVWLADMSPTYTVIYSLHPPKDHHSYVGYLDKAQAVSTMSIEQRGVHKGNWEIFMGVTPMTTDGREVAARARMMRMVANEYNCILAEEAAA